MTALFVVLAIDAYKARRSLPQPVIAVGIGLVSAALFGANMLAPAMGAYVLVLIIGYLISRARGRELPRTGELDVVDPDDGTTAGQEPRDV